MKDEYCYGCRKEDFDTFTLSQWINIGNNRCMYCMKDLFNDITSVKYYEDNTILCAPCLDSLHKEHHKECQNLSVDLVYD